MKHSSNKKEIFISYDYVLEVIHWELSLFLNYELTKAQSSWFQTFALLWMFYSFSSVIPRRLNFKCRRFGTLCSIFIGRNMKMEQKCSETSAHKIQMPGNHPKERIQKKLNTPTYFNAGHQYQIYLKSVTHFHSYARKQTSGSKWPHWRPTAERVTANCSHTWAVVINAWSVDP